jgi:hypothetical protein
MDQETLKKTEQLIDISYDRPAISDSFRSNLESQFFRYKPASEVRQSASKTGLWFLRLAGALLLLFCISYFIMNPTKVVAQIAKWLGYSSSTGLVSEPASVMSLTEPVQIEFDNITVLVPSAMYSKDRTIIDYFVFPNAEVGFTSMDSCQIKRFLTLPGSDERYEENAKGQFPSLPDGSQEVILNLPCMDDSSNSENSILKIPLRFQSSDEKLSEQEFDISQQVIENGSSGKIQITQSFKEDSYWILVTDLVLDPKSENIFHIAGVPVIVDANGTLLAYDSPAGSQKTEGTKNTPLHANFKFSELGVTFPLTITVPVRITEGPMKDLFEGEPEQWSVLWNPSNQGVTTIETACISSDSISTLFTTSRLESAIWLVENSDGSWSLNSSKNQAILIAEEAHYVSVSTNQEYAGIIDEQGLTIRNIENGKESKYSGIFSSRAIWNRESNRIAVQSGNSLLVFTAGAKLINTIQIPLGSSLAGWGSNSESLLFGTQDIYGQGYILRSVDLDNGEILNIFYLDKSAIKNINLQISSDGNWIAYRGAQQATLMIKNLRTGETKTLIDAERTLINPTAINNFFWSSDSLGLVVEIQQARQEEFSNYLINTETCLINRLVEDLGSIQEVFIEE